MTIEEIKAAAGIAQDFEAWAFGDDADSLAALVLDGKKRATSSAHIVYKLEGEPVPSAGDVSIILDSRGEALCVIKNTAVSLVPFNKVDGSFAAKEGEGDLSLSHWRRVHKDFFTRELEPYGLEFDEEMIVVCEEFELIYPKKQ